MSILPVCKSVYIMCSLGSAPGTGGIDGCEPFFSAKSANALNAEPSLQPVVR